MLNLNKELNEIILKYKVDRRNRRFREYLMAVELLNKLVSEHNEIIFLCQSEVDTFMLHQDVIRDNGFECMVIDAANDNFIESIYESKKIVVASYCYNGEVSQLLTENGIEHICLYDYFVLNGLDIDYEYYNVYCEGNREFYRGEKTSDYCWYSPYDDIIYDKSRIKAAEDGELKKIYMERLIFKLVNIRDFITAKEYIDKYNTMYCHDTLDYSRAWFEISALIEKIKINMQNRNCRDIVVFWIDALDFGDDTAERMPFLNSQSDNALVFENAHTVTVYTRPTLKTMLLGQKAVDDASYKVKKITMDNSLLIAKLLHTGYSFKYYGASNIFDLSLKSKIAVFMHMPASKIYWNFLNDIINTQMPVFCILHELCETHVPCLSVGIEKNYLPNHLEINATSLNENIIAQKMASDKYFDAQLNFYSSILPRTATKIYMSDHGRKKNYRFHTILKVTDDNIPKLHESRMFSLCDFDKLIQYILEPDDIKYHNLFAESVDVQDTPWYDPMAIHMDIINKMLWCEERVGYRGVITEKDIYIRYNHGVEYYHKRKNDSILLTEERLEELRAMAGTYMNDIENDEHFKYSRYTFKIIDRYRRRNHAYEERKEYVLKGLFENVDSNSCLAVRAGGETCLRLLQKIGLDLCKKIRYIIDENPDCLAGKMGIPIIDPARISEYPIDVIIKASAFANSPIGSMPELDGLDCKIIGLYDYLAENGVKCTRDFWVYEFEESDFDVGFPFGSELRLK